MCEGWWGRKRQQSTKIMVTYLLWFVVVVVAAAVLQTVVDLSVLFSVLVRTSQCCVENKYVGSSTLIYVKMRIQPCSRSYVGLGTSSMVLIRFCISTKPTYIPLECDWICLHLQRFAKLWIVSSQLHKIAKNCQNSHRQRQNHINGRFQPQNKKASSM